MSETLLSKYCPNDGECYLGLRSFLIQEGHDPDYNMEVILHEVVEAWNGTLELKMPHRTITALGLCLHRFLAENKGLLQ